jgi:short-subunit dehydrogenase
MAEKEGRTERKVAVITGASSGIGLATALQFAEKGYNVVLAARRMSELQEVARQCEEKGVESLSVETDVSRESDIRDLCSQAVEAFGFVNVWVNNAGVYIAGKFQDIPIEDMRRLMDVNLFGYIYGSRAALRQFREQGYGTLINVSSVNASAPQPYVSIYSASKAAIRALDEAIRMELRLDGLLGKINVCTIMPASVDTNLFQNGANYTGKQVQAIEPVYDPAYVAKRIWQLAENPRREKYVGPAGTFLALQRSHTPGSYEKRISAFTAADLLAGEPMENTTGNLYGSIEANRGMRGGWREKRIRGDRFNMATGASLAALAGLLSFGVYLFNKGKARA